MKAGQPEKIDRNKKIIKKHFKGWSLRKIGSFYNLHHSTVENIVNRDGDKYRNGCRVLSTGNKKKAKLEPILSS